MQSLNSQEIKNLIESGKFVIVDCYADWCGPCRALKPILEAAINAFPDVHIVGCDIETNHDFARENIIKSVPTMLWYKNGKLIHTSVGIISSNILFEKIRDYSQ
jgi:thioredoxin